MIKMAEEEVNKTIKKVLENYWNDGITQKDLIQIRERLQQEYDANLWCGTRGLETYFVMKDGWFKKDEKTNTIAVCMEFKNKKMKNQVDWVVEQGTYLVEADVYLNGESVSLKQAMDTVFLNSSKKLTFRAVMKYISLTIDEERMAMFFQEKLIQQVKSKMKKRMDSMITVLDAKMDKEFLNTPRQNVVEWQMVMGNKTFKGKSLYFLNLLVFDLDVDENGETQSENPIVLELEKQFTPKGMTLEFPWTTRADETSIIEKTTNSFLAEKIVEKLLETKEFKMQERFNPTFQERRRLLQSFIKYYQR